MADKKDMKFDENTKQELFSEEFILSEVAYLKDQLNEERILEIHAECAMHKYSRWNLARRERRYSKFEKIFNIVGMSCSVAWGSVFLLSDTWRRNWRSVLSYTGIVCFFAIALLFSQTIYVVVTRLKLDSFPPEGVKPDNVDVMKRLHRLLGIAELSDESSPTNLKQRSLQEHWTLTSGYLGSLDRDAGLKYRNLIRILVLEPGTFSTDLRGRVETYFRHNAPEYEALSYVWGSPFPPEVIIIDNDKKIRITINLHNALRSLRYETRPRYLWIDAICINQRHDEEKSQQVRIMSEIYEEATAVLVYLNDTFVPSGNEQFKKVFDFLIAVEEGAEPNPASNGRNISPPVESFFYVLKKSWWSRIWVIQEFAYSQQEPLIGYGKWWVKSSTFLKGFEMIREKYREDLNSQDWRVRRNLRGVSNESLLSRWELLESRQFLLSWRARAHPVTGRLSNLVKDTRLYRATDPRDKVFALQSLMMDPCRIVFAPDYSKQASTVYTAMATYLLCIEGWSEIYRYFCIGTVKDSPSWVPDFSYGNEGRSDRLWVHALPPRFGEVDCYVKSGVLAIRGVDCGQITKVWDFKHSKGTPISAQPRDSYSETWQQAIPTALDSLLNWKYQDKVKRNTKPEPKSADCGVGLVLEPENHRIQEQQRRLNDVQPTLAVLKQELKADKQLIKTRLDRMNLERQEIEPDILTTDTGHFAQLHQSTRNCSVFKTDLNIKGVAPSIIRAGDRLVILFGIETVFVARGVNKRDKVIVGKARISTKFREDIRVGIDDGTLKDERFYFH